MVFTLCRVYSDAVLARLTPEPEVTCVTFSKLEIKSVVLSGDPKSSVAFSIFLVASAVGVTILLHFVVTAGLSDF